LRFNLLFLAFLAAYIMHLLILTQFYPPEFGAAAIRLSRLARLLVRDGQHQVTVLTGMPNYPSGIIPPQYRRHLLYRETMDGVDVRRVWVYASPSKSTSARLLNQFSFMALAALRGMFLTRPDVILVESHPLFVCLTGGWLKRIKRAPIVLNVSDLWPESAVATGALRADSTMVKVASRVERWAYHDADHIVSMTAGVDEGILAVHPQRERVTLIKNAVDLDQFRPRPASPERAAMRQQLGVGDRFTAVHVGNMSLTYDMDTILEAARDLPEVAFVFAGGGSQVERVAEAAHVLPNVTLTGVLPHDQMPALWAAADACLIALRDHSVAGGTLPAKMYEALATGTPIVAAIRGEGAALLEESGAGIVVSLADPGAMANALCDLAAHPERRQSLSAAGRAYAESHLSPQQVKDAYLAIFERVASNRR
jgi:glycosyltransferase involved in cell wall biosynthesis